MVTIRHEKITDLAAREALLDRLWMPGPYERARLLGCELEAGALDDARGLISPSGRPAPKPDLAALIAGVTGGPSAVARRAA